MKRHLADRKRISPRAVCLTCTISFLLGTVCSLAAIQISGGLSPQWQLADLNVPAFVVPDAMSEQLRMLYHNASFFSSPSPMAAHPSNPAKSSLDKHGERNETHTPPTAAHSAAPAMTATAVASHASAVLREDEEVSPNKGVVQIVQGGMDLKDRSAFVDSWKGEMAESCAVWTTRQRAEGAYVDAYVVGSQKGATSQLSKQLHMLGVRKENMAKEWHFFNQLTADGQIIHGRTVGQPLPSLHDIEYLRRMHFSMGFPSARTNDTSISLPLVDPVSPNLNASQTETLKLLLAAHDDAASHLNETGAAASAEEETRGESARWRRAIESEREEYNDFRNRSLVIDMTVEYLHSERSAILAKKLTPHTRIIITVRDPLARALSHYNMAVRNGNAKLRATNSATRRATPESFDRKVREEASKLARCGYDARTATLDRPTSAVAACMLNNSYREHFDDMLYVTRGLYALHIESWRSYFPDHRILILSFRDLALGKRDVFRDLTDFLCVTRFPDSLLDQFERDGSTLSFGQQAASKGLEEAGSDSYSGDDRYLPDMLPDTRRFLEHFYAPANEKLKRLIGTHFVYWSDNDN